MKKFSAILLISVFSSVVAAQTERELVQLLAGDDPKGEKVWVAHEHSLLVDLALGEVCQSGEEQRYFPKGKLIIRSCVNGKVNSYETHWSLIVNKHHAVITIDNQQYQFNPYKSAEIPENTYIELISISEASKRPFKFQLLVHSEL